MERVTSSPRQFILWPASFYFILSYPFLYTLLTASLPTTSIDKPISIPAPLYDDTLLQPSIPLSDDSTASIINVKQMYISPPVLTNVLATDFLDSIDPIINSLLPPNQSLSIENAQFDSLKNTEIPSVLSSPNSFKFNSLPYLHYYHPPSPDSEFSSLSEISPVFLKSVLYLLRSSRNHENVASGLLVSYFYNTTTDEKRWNNTIDLINTIIQNDQHDSLKQPLQDQVSFLIPTTAKQFKSSIASYVRSLPYAFFPYCPFPLLNVIVTYTLLAVYAAISWDISTVQSKTGLFVAFLAQITLTMCSSFTIVSYFFPTFSHNSLRHFLIIPYFIAVIGIENISRFLSAIARTPHENPPVSRIKAAFLDSFSQTLKKVVTDVCILLIPSIPFFPVCNQVKHMCLFTVIALLIDLALHATYFTAILSIDLRRFELEDLLSEHYVANSQSSPYITFLNAGKSLPEFLRPQYLYIRHLYFHPKISLSTFVLIGMLIFMHMWALLTDPANMRFYSSGRISFFFTDLTPFFRVFANFSFVRVFEPVVIQGIKSPILSTSANIHLTSGAPIIGTFSQFIRLLSVNVVLELFASIAFILSLTGVILKYMLPPSKESSSPSESSSVVKFFSKDLIGFHTLDVLHIITQGTTISTVSLDHKVCVWNASLTTGQNRAVKPIPIPFPTEFWPVTKVVLNSSTCVIAIFSSKTAGIRSWDYKNNKLLYHIQDRTLFNALPIETFFSGSDLVVVTKECSVISISENGQSIHFPIDFPSKTAKVIHAKRLVTPRIPERVICLSSENEITIGTHIGKTWRFRMLMIQESPIQFNLHTLQSQGVHDLSKYKPRPIPAPQAMMARSPMRMGRMAAMRNESAIPPPRRPTILDDKIIALVPVPAVNMVLIATSIHACLFDAQTGIIVKHFQTGHLKPSSLRVFHSQPTHCRFCGCVSVDTLSVAYSDAEQDGTVICHTLTIDNRAKNSICIRVERDPRETRCLGFEATTERQHWIDRVEGWDTTDMNMIMGVRRKELPSSVSTSNGSGFSVVSYISELAQKKVVPTLVAKSTGASSTLSSASELKSRSSKGFSVSGFVSSRASDSKPEPSNRLGTSYSSKPNLNTTWEGWALSATGQVSYYDIPNFDTGSINSNSQYANGNDRMKKGSISPFFSKRGSSTIGTELDKVSFDRLLIRSIGPVTKYGAKSIVVAFGNVIKVLYFGKEESLTPELDPLGASEPLYVHSNLAKYNQPSHIMPNGMGMKTSTAQGSRKWRREVGY